MTGQVNDARIDPGMTPGILHALHYRDLVRMAALMVDSRALAEDIVQDAFAELHSRWSVIDPTRALPYLRRTVTNGCHSALRRRRTVRNRRLVPVPDIAPADEGVLRAAGHQALLDAIAALPARQREVLVLRYYEELTINETADALGIKPTAVSASAHRALRALAALKEDLR